MSDDVERIGSALWELLLDCPLNVAESAYLAPRVLAAIRAAASEAAMRFNENERVSCYWSEMPDYDQKAIVDAALAALTDHPGGTDK